MNTELTKRENYELSIDNGTLEDVAALSDDWAMWVKLRDSGFEFVSMDKTVPELVGKIIDIRPYLVRFENGQPDKLPHCKNDLEIPEGYERRCDIKIETQGQVVGISLSKSSFIHQLSPFIKFLKNQGLRPEQVMTRLQSKQASNNLGVWNICTFEMVETPPQQSPANAQDPWD